MIVGELFAAKFLYPNIYAYYDTDDAQ